MVSRMRGHTPSPHLAEPAIVPAPVEKLEEKHQEPSGLFSKIQGLFKGGNREFDSSDLLLVLILAFLYMENEEEEELILALLFLLVF